MKVVLRDDSATRFWNRQNRGRGKEILMKWLRYYQKQGIVFAFEYFKR